MLKKLVVLGMAIAAMAALPATAGAVNLYNAETGKLVPTETAMTLTQDASLPVITKSTTLGKIECTNIMVNGTLKANGSGTVEASGTSGIAEPCTVNGKSGANVTKVAGSIKSTTGDNGQATFEFVIDVPNVGTCTFFTPAGVPATGTFTTNSNTLKLNTSELESSPESCGEGSISGGLVAETAEGKGSKVEFK